MPTHITQIDDTTRRRTLLRVKGDLLIDDAILLERIASDIRKDTGTDVVIDLAELDFLDSDAAEVLRRLDTGLGFEIEGMETFLQSVINAAEKNNRPFST